MEQKLLLVDGIQPPLTPPSKEGDNTIASVEQVSVNLNSEQTNNLLSKVSSVYQTQIQDILLTALVQAFYTWTNSKSLWVDLETYGRENLFNQVDITRTVGWFTNIFPVELDLGKALSLGDSIRSIKEQLRQINNGGIDYGVAKYLNQDHPSEVQNLAQVPVKFNYLGQLKLTQENSVILGLAIENDNLSSLTAGDRSHLLEINAFILDGEFKIHWIYSRNIHRREAINNLANNFIDRLVSLINHCMSPEKEKKYTPSDFSAAKLDGKQLNKLMKKWI